MGPGTTDSATTSRADISWDATVIRSELRPVRTSPPNRPLPVSTWPGLSLWTDEYDGAAWLFLSGELDLATAPLIDESLAAAQHARDAVVVDLRDLDFMDVSGLTIFLAAAKRAGESGGRFSIVNSRPSVRRVFEATCTTFMLDSLTSAPDRTNA
jgi:anti-sigma B factor antagonist